MAWQPAPSSAEPIAGQKPNVLFLLTDDQRPDTIHALGNPIIRTPHLDRLVRAGMAFTRATCGNPICTPSRAEIQTGASGFRNDVLDFAKPVSTKCARWAQTMRDAGYRTYYVGKWHNSGLPSHHGFTAAPGLFGSGGGRFAEDQLDSFGRPVTGYRGWIFKTEAGQMFPEFGVGLTPGISRRFADEAIAVINDRADEPFFMQVNFTAPHDPLLWPPGYESMYQPEQLPLPPNFAARHPFDHGNLDGRDEQLLDFPRTAADVRRELAIYYAVISHLDEQIGRILQALDTNRQTENTIIIFSSDHGLAMGSHGLRGKQNMYEHTIGVPLIIAGPNLPRDRKSAAQCYLRDLFPTVCDLINVAIPETVEGRSLKPVLDGTTDDIRSEIFGYFRHSQRMIRTDRWKYIEYPEVERRQLFDLTADPFEQSNLSDAVEHRSITTELADRLHAWQRSVDDPALRRLASD